MGGPFLLLLGILIVWLAYTGRAGKMIAIIQGKA